MTGTTGAPSNWDRQRLDERITADIYAGHDDWAIAEGLVDQDVSRGAYEGCSSELEMAFIEYESRVQRIREEIGRLPGYVVDATNPPPADRRLSGSMSSSTAKDAAEARATGSDDRRAVRVEPGGRVHVQAGPRVRPLHGRDKPAGNPPS